MGGTDKLIQSGHRVGVEYSSSEVAELAGGVGDAVITIDAEGDTGANVFRASVQLKDKNGADFVGLTSFMAYVADDAVTGGLGAAPSAGIAAGSVGEILDEPLANQVIRCLPSTAGLMELDLTDAATPTLFLVVVLPDGRLVVGPKMTWA